MVFSFASFVVAVFEASVAPEVLSENTLLIMNPSALDCVTVRATCAGEVPDDDAVKAWSCGGAIVPVALIHCCGKLFADAMPGALTAPVATSVPRTSIRNAALPRLIKLTPPKL